MADRPPCQVSSGMRMESSCPTCDHQLYLHRYPDGHCHLCAAIDELTDSIMASVVNTMTEMLNDQLNDQLNRRLAWKKDIE